MKKLRIYLDTSVIGGCFDVEFSAWSNGLMKDFAAGTFIPILSDVVAAEIQDAPAAVRQKYELLLSSKHELVLVTEEVIDLADAYQRRKILTPKFYDDGLHIALASVAEADLLVSWNFKHIVHFDKIRLFTSVNLEQGYKPLQIYSPREVTKVEGG
jgi:predicted nucleic acid-binding protein